MREVIEENKKTIITILILLGTMIVLFIFSSIMNREDKKKAIQGEDYVYTIVVEKDEKSENSDLPQINLKSEEVEELNDEIADYYTDVISDPSNYYNFGYKVNKKYISLLVKTIVNEFDETYFQVIKKQYKSYNVDIKTEKVVNNYELFNEFNITEEQVKQVIENKINEFYTKDTNSGIIIKKLCDINCYKEIRKYKFDEIAYTVEDNHLYGYINLHIGQDNPNFKEEDFRILIK